MNLEHILASVLEQIPERIDGQLISGLLLSPWFFGGLLAVLALESIAPARPIQKAFGLGLREDLLWVAFGIPVAVVTIAACLTVSREVYRAHLGFLTIHATESWPWLCRVLLALVVTDFVKWLTHVARHKVRFLWRYHAVHHSQTELNFFSDFRIHPGDHAADLLLRSVAVYMVDQSFATIAAVEWLRQWHARLYHANVRSNFGILRYVLVTPQSHRIHHSIDPRHADTNFGAMFSVWDRLFRTQYPNADEYPETGVRDGGYAFAGDGSWRSILHGFCHQMLAPLRATSRAERSHAVGSGPADPRRLPRIAP